MNWAINENMNFDCSSLFPPLSTIAYIHISEGVKCHKLISESKNCDNLFRLVDLQEYMTVNLNSIKVLLVKFLK